MSDPAFQDIGEDPALLERVLVDLGVARRGGVHEVVRLTGGVSSTILRVQLHDGAVCVKQALPKLKVAKDWHAPTSRVFAEMDWLKTAYAIIPGRVPRVIAEDRAHGIFAMEFLEGLTNWKDALLRGEVDVAVGEQVAQALVQVHAATAGDAAVAARFPYDDTFHALRLEPYLVETARVHADLADTLLGLARDTQAHHLALVHGDVSPKNIMLSPRGPILLDAECAWYGDPAFDLAFLLNHALLKGAHRPADAARFDGLYTRIVDTYLARVTWEPRDRFEQRCARLLPALLLARVDGKSPVEYLDEPTRGTVRQAARALLLERPDILADLLPRWHDETRRVDPHRPE